MTFPVPVATTCRDWIPAPLLTTSRSAPSGDSTALTGRSPSGIWLPAGVIVRLLMSRVLPEPCSPGSPAPLAAAKAAPAPPTTIAAAMAAATTRRLRPRPPATNGRGNRQDPLLARPSICFLLLFAQGVDVPHLRVASKR